MLQMPVNFFQMDAESGMDHRILTGIRCTSDYKQRSLLSSKGNNDHHMCLATCICYGKITNWFLLKM